MSPGEFEGFLEGQVRQQPLERLVDLLDRGDLGPEHVEVAQQSAVVSNLVNQVLGLEEGLEILVTVRADKTADNSATAASRENVGQHVFLPHGLHGTDVEEQQRARAAHDECGTAVAMTRAMKEVEPLIERYVVCLLTREELERIYDFVDELHDEPLGAEPGLAIERTTAHAVDVAMDALVQREQEAHVVAARA